MQTLYTLTLCAALSSFSMLGCSDAQQLDHAQGDLAEEQNETAEARDDATEEGMVTNEEAEDIVEEQGETAAAAGEVVEQKGELIQEKTD